MGSADILRNWIPVGDIFYQRAELYGTTWSSSILESPGSQANQQGPLWLEAAPFGGPIVTVWSNGRVRIHTASGREISHFTWDHKLPFPVTVSWSHREEPVFVVDDGTIIVYSLHGQYQKSITMGEEVRQTRVKQARVFRSGNFDVTGVIVLTEANRFFVVNNIHMENSRARKLHDINIQGPAKSLSWSVLAPSRGVSKSRGGARVIAGGIDTSLPKNQPGDRNMIQPTYVTVLSEHGTAVKAVEKIYANKGNIHSITVASDQEHVCLYFDSGILWMGTESVDTNKLEHLNDVSLAVDESEGFEPDSFVWCGTDAVLCLSPSTSKIIIVSAVADGAKSVEFVFGHLATVQEIDGARLLTNMSQEWLQAVPEALHHTVALVWKDSPGNKLLKATEEKEKGSHRAIEYIRSLLRADGEDGESAIDTAVSECIESAGLIVDNPVHQKEMIRAAQFGKSFSTTSSSGDTAGSSGSSRQSFFFNTHAK